VRDKKNIRVSKVPSTAFCLLVRLFTLRVTEKQMTAMLQHPDSPYIRCIGFLYLRYGCEPNGLFKWFEPYLYDSEPVKLYANTKNMSTVGKYSRDLLMDMNYFSTTLLPRLPTNVERDIKVKLLLTSEIQRRAESHFANNMSYFSNIGVKVRAMYEDEQNPVAWYDAVIQRVLTKNETTGQMYPHPKFIVHFPEYGNTEIVSLGELDLPYNNSIMNNSSHNQQHDYLDQVRRQERSNITSKGRNYGARPPTFKGSLAAKPSSNKRQSSAIDYCHKSSHHKHPAPVVHSPKNTTSHSTASFLEKQEKKRKLFDRYG